MPDFFKFKYFQTVRQQENKLWQITVYYFILGVAVASDIPLLWSTLSFLWNGKEIELY